MTSHVFDPEEFFHFATEIMGDSNASESKLRTAVSRAYYSAHLIARDALFGVDAPHLTARLRDQLKKRVQKKGKKDPGNHAIVIFAVSEKNVSLSTQLDQLRQARVNADYHRDPSYLVDAGKNSWREYAEESLALASQLLPSLKRLSSYYM